MSNSNSPELKVRANDGSEYLVVTREITRFPDEASECMVIVRPKIGNDLKITFRNKRGLPDENIWLGAVGCMAILLATKREEVLRDQHKPDGHLVIER